MGLILKTGAILSGNVALTSDGVEEVRPPQWDNPVVLGSMSGIYGTASKLVIDGTEVTGGTLLFNEPSSENTSVWANDVVVGSMSGIYGTASKLVIDGTEVTGGQVLYGFDRPNDSIWTNDVVLGSMTGIYGTASKLLLDGTEVTGGTLLFNEPDAPNTSIWANDVVVGSMSGIYGTASKLVIDGTEVTGGTILDGFSEPDDSVWANPVVVGSMSGIYSNTSQIMISLVSSSTSEALVGPGVTYPGGSPFGTGHEGQTQWGPGPSAAFDISPNTEFHTIASGTRNLGYDFGQVQHVSSYKMHPRKDGSPHLLTGWDVMASDDGVNWRKIGQERNVSWPNRFASLSTYPDLTGLSDSPWEEFTISDPSSNNMFRYLRLDFVSTNDGYGYMVVPGLAFYGDPYNQDNSNVTEFTLSGNLESSETMSSGDFLTIDANIGSGSYHSTSFTVDKSTAMEIHMWGAGGGGTKRSTGVTGGNGGYSSGTYTFEPNIEYHIVVGGGGEGGYQDPVNNDAYGAYSTGGGRSGSNISSVYDGAAGGGYTGIFAGYNSHDYAIIIAGGGGGGTGDTASGGAGGGDSGATGSNGGRAGGGGTQLAGGGGAGVAGSALQGGDGIGAGAGGGGGYYGGGGGGNSGPGAGGGGSGYISTELTEASTSSWITNSYHRNDAGLGGSSGLQGNNGLLVFRKVS